MKEFFKQINWKFFGGFTALIALGLLTWYIGVSLSPEAREERAAREHLKNLQEQYENDTFGGETPEKTIQLFIEALEAGDIDLASKYFLPDDREKIADDLTKTQNNGELEGVIARMEKLEITKQDNGTAFFVIANEDNVVQIQVTLGKNENDTWKIIDL